MNDMPFMQAAMHCGRRAAGAVSHHVLIALLQYDSQSNARRHCPPAISLLQYASPLAAPDAIVVQNSQEILLHATPHMPMEVIKA